MKTIPVVLWSTVLLMQSVSVAAEPEPAEIFDKVTAAYNALDTYSADGTIVADLDNNGHKIKLETSFSLKLQKPNKYLIIWEQKNSASPVANQAGAVWSDGEQPKLFMAGAKAYFKMKGDEMALGSATGISGGAAYTIPGLFFQAFKKHPSPFKRITSPKLEANEKIGDEECYVISGASSLSKKETYWISTKTYFIKQYARSFEAPTGGVTLPKFTDEQIEQAIKGMGGEVTPEKIEAMRAAMQKARDATKNFKLKGDSTETQLKIATPKMSEKDFEFELPPGTELKDSFFGGKANPKQK